MSEEEKKKAQGFQTAMEGMARRIAKQEIGKYHIAVQIASVDQSMKEAEEEINNYKKTVGGTDNEKAFRVQSIMNRQKAIAYYVKTLKMLKEDQQKIGVY